MKRCQHTNWISLCSEGNDSYLAVSDRLDTIKAHIPEPDSRRPSLFVLIGNRAKSIALRELFGAKRNQRFVTRRVPGEIHLHVEASSIFNERPLLIADSDLPSKACRAKVPSTKCHETTKRIVQRAGSLAEIASRIYAQLLSPFIDVFCFFSDDLGGFEQVAHHLATWLEQSQESTVPRSTRPRVVIVTEKIPAGVENEKEARKAFLWLLSEETKRDPFKQVSAIEVIALFPAGALSVNARHRLLKERIMAGSDLVRENRVESRSLFSVTHMAAFLVSACEHFSKAIDQPFDFVMASRVDNPVPRDLDEHLANLLKHVSNSGDLIAFAAPTIASSFLLDSYPPGSHCRSSRHDYVVALNANKSIVFHPEHVLESLYKGAFPEERVIPFADSKDAILRSGLISLVSTHLRGFFEQLTHDSIAAVEIHRCTLNRFKSHWRGIQSSSTCLCCLRRRPQYGLSCGHILCENCVLVFGTADERDPWMYKIHHCFLCGEGMSEEVAIRVHPPTAGVGILCIDGGGTRGELPLRFMKRIQDRIGLPIPFQKFFKVAFGISSGKFSDIWLIKLQLTLTRGAHRVGHVCQRMGHRRVYRYFRTTRQSCLYASESVKNPNLPQLY